MAAEILDIEAKLDTSQVQGQLQQLSKTSGLQGLDRAIKTLETSMKKLSAQMDKAAQQAASGGGSGAARGSSWLGGEKFAGGRALRGFGGYMVGRTLQEIGEASGSDSLKTAGKYAGNIARGAAVGGLVGGPVGALAGAGLGALQTALENATDAVENFRKALADFTAKYESQKKGAENLLNDYNDRRFKEYVGKATDRTWLNMALGDKQSWGDAARRRERAAADKLEDFQKSDYYASTGKLLEQARLQDFVIGDDDNWVERLKDRMAGNDVRLTDQQQQSIIGALKQQEGLMKELAAASAEVARADELREAVQKRIDELDKEAAKTAKEKAQAAEKEAKAAEQAAAATQRLEKLRDKTRAGYAEDLRESEFQQKLESLRAGAEFSGMSQDDIKSRASQAAFAYNVGMDELNKLRKEASTAEKPEDYAERIRAKETDVDEKRRLADMWQQMITGGSGASASLSDLAGMLGPTSSLASMGLGLGGELIEDKLLNNTDRMLALLRIVADNSKKWTQTETTNIATYQS